MPLFRTATAAGSTYAATLPAGSTVAFYLVQNHSTAEALQYNPSDGICENLSSTVAPP